MSFLSVIFILTFLSCTKSNNTHYGFSDCSLSQCSSNSNVPLNYSRKNLKCYGCINNSGEVKQHCSRKGKFITCKYSDKLLNWLDISYKKSMRYGCLLLVYRESGNIVVRRGCVGLPTEDYSVCTALKHNFKLEDIIQCFVCNTDRCNVSKSDLGKCVSKLLILPCLILIYCNYFNNVF